MSQTQKESIKKDLCVQSTEDDLYELFHRCGDLPQKVYKEVQKAEASQVVGPFWAPDCRHVAWSMSYYFQGGWLGELSEEQKKNMDTSVQVNELEGVYLYDDRTQNILKVYQPLKVNESFEFRDWKDKDTVVYIKEGRTFIYNIVSETSEPFL